ncbi:hypothetical protein HWV00_11265 [Moritella sp. 24]|uniref:M64 family metallopeptidase n=1 Tax=Moritella sp. 24 TaxID=2746230 RepID=UPI001BA82D0C|nr:M64 family metallopeptidase [Moritella sp. 24]QUM76766.1 hypothetical protein HWV00_11265 [Moritella sp. 24]
MKLLLYFVFLVSLIGCSDSDSGDNSNNSRADDMNIIRNFILSDGSDDFSGDIIAKYVGGLYDDKTLPFYKAYLLNDKDINLADDAALTTLVDNTNGIFDELKFYQLFSQRVRSIGAVNVDKGFNARFVNQIESKVTDLQQEVDDKHYSVITALVDNILAMQITTGYINYNIIAKQILGDISSAEISLFFRAHYNRIVSKNSAQVIAEQEGLSFGYINQELAPKSESKVFVVRENTHLFWNTDSTDTDLRLVMLNAIKLFSKVGSDYRISQSSPLEAALSQYLATHNVDFSIENKVFDSSLHDAYFSVHLNEAKDQCHQVEEYIKQGADLFIYHSTAGSKDDLNSFANKCMVDIIQHYYGIELTLLQNVNKRSYAFNTQLYPYSFSNNSGTPATENSPSIGMKADDLRYNTDIADPQKHQMHMDIAKSVYDLSSIHELSQLITDVKTAYADKQLEDYYQRLFTIMTLTSHIIREQGYQVPTLVKVPKLLQLNNSQLPLRFFRYSIDYGRNFNNATDYGVPIFNQGFQPHEIVVTLKDEVRDFLSLSQTDGYLTYAEEIIYQPIIVSGIDLDSPIYVSDDLNYKIYGSRIDGLGFDLAIAGDGYLERDRALFNMHVKNAVEAFLSYENIPPHIGLYNIHSVFTPSNERGADWAIEEGCDPTSFDNCTRADYAPSKDLIYKNDKDTTFHSGFYLQGTSNIARLLGINLTLVQAAVNAYAPQYDQIITLVNTNVYGGAGGSITTSNKMNPGVFIHELGHSFAGLHDEYTYGGNGVPPGFCSFNVCVDFDKSPWKHFMPTETIDSVCKDVSEACPSGTIGWFEGGYYETKGIWRPTDTSIMHSLGAPFYAYNAEIWAANLYDRSWQFMINTPRQESLGATARLINNPEQDDLHFRVHPTNEMGEYQDQSIRVQALKWFINGVHQPDLDNKTELFYGALETGQYNIKFESTDVSGILVDPTKLTQQFEWTVNNNSVVKKNLVSHTEPKVNGLRINITLYEQQLQITTVDAIHQYSSRNNKSMALFDGYMLRLSRDGVHYDYLPLSVYFHNNGRLTQYNRQLPTTLHFDVVMDQSMLQGVYHISLWRDNQQITEVPAITFHPSHYY